MTAVNLFYDVFQKEKMSHILPLNSFDRIFTTVLGFFLFHTTSWITVLFALLAAAILIVSQIDFKTFRLSWYVVLFVIIGALKSSSQLITGYLLAYLTSFELFLSWVTAAFLLMLVYTSIRWELRGIWKSVSRPVVACRTIDKVFVVASTLITYSVIKEFGLVTMLLISFFWYISKLILAFVLLKEVPSLKETLVWLSILLCIFLGTYYG